VQASGRSPPSSGRSAPPLTAIDLLRRSLGRRGAAFVALGWVEQAQSPGASQPNALAPCLTQSLSATSAIRCQTERCVKPTEPAAFMSCQSAPRSSPWKSSASSK
jgi:hypothetical protein